MYNIILIHSELRCQFCLLFDFVFMLKFTNFQYFVHLYLKMYTTMFIYKSFQILLIIQIAVKYNHTLPKKYCKEPRQRDHLDHVQLLQSSVKLRQVLCQKVVKHTLVHQCSYHLSVEITLNQSLTFQALIITFFLVVWAIYFLKVGSVLLITKLDQTISIIIKQKYVAIEIQVPSGGEGCVAHYF